MQAVGFAPPLAGGIGGYSPKTTSEAGGEGPAPFSLDDPKTALAVSRSTIQELVKSPYRERGAGSPPPVLVPSMIHTPMGRSTRSAFSPKSPLRERQTLSRESEQTPVLSAEKAGSYSSLKIAIGCFAQPINSVKEEENAYPRQQPQPRPTHVASVSAARSISSVLAALSMCTGISPKEGHTSCVDRSTHYNGDEDDSGIVDRSNSRYEEERNEDDTDESITTEAFREEEERMQMRRLGSWSTLGTMGTIDSFLSLDTIPSNAFDDDGNPIDRTLLERRRQMREKLASASRKKRVVKFDYPPVSSLRECPRPDPNDLPELFFTEQELDIYEADREQTHMTDDIEIVAVGMSSDSNKSRSSSSEDGIEYCAGVVTPVNDTPSAKAQVSNRSPSPHFFGNYISTPRIWTKKKQSHFSFQEQGRGLRMASPTTEKGRSTPVPETVEVRKTTTSPFSAPPRSPAPERLIKSVQIMLRERSSGRHNKYG